VQEKKRFNTRAFVTLTIALSALGLPIAGLPLHLLDSAPPTVARHAWMTAHNALGFVFVTFAIWHVVLNRRALRGHLRRAAARAGEVNREAFAALAVIAAALMFVGHAFLVR
jgi:hypothetical protein